MHKSSFVIGVVTAGGALRGSGAFLRELEATGSRATEAAGQRRRSFLLFFRDAEMQLNLGQNIWAVLALFMLFPTHISD